MESTVQPARMDRLIEEALPSIRTKLRTFVSIAASNGSSISSAELLLLLPQSTFDSERDLEKFVTGVSRLRAELTVSQGELTFRGSEHLIRQRREQVILAARYVRSVRSFAERLATLCPWLRLVGISGSVAYGRTRERDDIDFFLVTNRDRVWITLLFAMVLAKLHRRRASSAPVYCFNRVLDEARCAEAFRTSQGPLFAREALNIHVLTGETYYRELLQSAVWMERFFPALFREVLNRKAGGVQNRSEQRSRVWVLANWMAFAGLAPYLILANLFRNNRLQASGNVEGLFRTVFRRGLFAYESVKFDTLRETYRRAF